MAIAEKLRKLPGGATAPLSFFIEASVAWASTAFALHPRSDFSLP
jgi:hypothetical protein